jgi:ABC-type dipeptide/oligopeptide/nickel transport system permease subunit
VHQGLGTDTTGRDLRAELLYSILPTLEIGVLAGVLGTLLGVALGLVSRYVRGLPDAILRTVADVMLGVPSLAVLVVLAAFLGSSSIAELALIIATSPIQTYAGRESSSCHGTGPRTTKSEQASPPPKCLQRSM